MEDHGRSAAECQWATGFLDAALGTRVSLRVRAGLERERGLHPRSRSGEHRYDREQGGNPAPYEPQCTEDS